MNMTDFMAGLMFVVVIILCLVLFGGMVIGIGYWVVSIRIPHFNKVMNTSYTAWEYFWCSEEIKEFVKGRKFNLAVNQ